MSIAARTEPQIIRLASPIGMLAVVCIEGKVVSLDIGRPFANPTRHTDPATKKISAALKTYFTNSNYHIRLPMKLQGTGFQRRVWRVLQNIPVGETRTYGEIAKQLRSSARAVGMACRANPIPVIVPCHRVVAATGLGGYAGQTAGRQLQIKRWLLHHEGVRFE